METNITNEVQEVSFKDRILNIYKELDSLDIDEIKDEIDKIKKEVECLIKLCDESSRIKDEILINDAEKQQNRPIPIAMRTKNHKSGTIVEPARYESNVPVIKNIITIGLLIGFICCLIALLFVVILN